MHRSSFLFALCAGFALATLAGCGDDSPNGGGGASNAVSGTIGGKFFDAKSVISGVYVSNGKPTSDVVMMANEPDLCAKISAGGLQNPPNFQMLFFGLSDVDLATGQTSVPTGTGTFEVVSSKSPSPPKTNHVASVFYMESDAMGMDVYPDLVVGTAGTITRSAVEGNAFAGKGDFALSTGDLLNIEYDATPCAALANFDPSNSPNAPPAQSAWNFNFLDGGNIECGTASQQVAFGVVDGASVTTRVADGEGGASVSCSVVSGAGGATFAVTGTATDSKGSSLAIDIPAITPAAMKVSPAKGAVMFSSAATGGGTWTDDCNFYFVPFTPEGVEAGKIWVAFTCPSLDNSMEICQAAESFALFENCAEN